MREPVFVFRVIAFVVLFASFSAFPCTANDKPSAPTNSIASVDDARPLSVADFLPSGFVSDGSVNYQEPLQRAIREAGKRKTTLRFLPIVYQVDEKGFEVYSNTTLVMTGATFQLRKESNQDGKVFWGRDIENVQFFGGKIIGKNETWKPGVNIRGIQLMGGCKNIRIRDMEFYHLTSNGVGVFGTVESGAKDIWVQDVIVENCCNHYGDYQSKKPGKEPGSLREDQGGIAFYYVDDFMVSGCRLDKSRSDGTHFYRCKNGQINNNKIRYSSMGGFFLETCQNITATGNIIQKNGSRGVTIERKSIGCTFTGNIVSDSGREGIWAPGCQKMVFSNNIILKNGRKKNGNSERSIWNANIKINEDVADPKSAEATDYVVSNNIIETTKEQIAAIRVVGGKTTHVLISNNILSGENTTIQSLGDKNARIVVRTVE